MRSISILPVRSASRPRMDLPLCRPWAWASPHGLVRRRQSRGKRNNPGSYSLIFAMGPALPAPSFFRVPRPDLPIHPRSLPRWNSAAATRAPLTKQSLPAGRFDDQNYGCPMMNGKRKLFPFDLCRGCDYCYTGDKNFSIIGAPVQQSEHGGPESAPSH